MKISQEALASYLEAIKTNPFSIKDIPIPEEKPSDEHKEIYMAAVKLNGESVKYIPKPKEGEKISSFYEELYLEAVKQSPQALRNIFIPKNGEPLTPGYKRIYLAAMKQNGYQLRFIHHPTVIDPLNRDYKEIYLAGVRKNGSGLLSIPKPSDGEPLTKDYKDIYIAALRQDSRIVELVHKPKMEESLSQDYKDIFSEVLKLDGKELEKILKFIPVPSNNDLSITGTLNPDYKWVCLEALKEDGDAVKFIAQPKGEELNQDFKDIYLAAVKQNGEALEFIPKPKQGEPLGSFYEELYLEAVKQNGDALKFIPQPKAGEELSLFYQKLYLTAAQQNGNALQHIPKLKEGEPLSGFYKQLYLDAVRNSLDALMYIPYEKFKKEITHSVLSEMKYILITGKNIAEEDREVQKAARVYSHAQKRVAKIAHISTKNIHLLLDKNIVLPEGVKVSVLSHAATDTNAMANMKAEDFCNLAVKQPHIKEFTLLGCNTVQTEISDKEKEMHQQFKEKRKEKLADPCGFVLTTKSFPNHLTPEGANEINKLLNKQVGLNSSYVLAKTGTGDNERYTLSYVKKENGTLSVETWPMDATQLKELASLAKGGKAFQFPSGQATTSVLHSKQRPLTPKSMLKIINTADDVHLKFEKTHPEYKDQKKIYPFLTSVMLNENEETKLQDSFMKKLVTAIKDDVRITRSINIGAFPNPLYVDDRDWGFHASHLRIYSGETSNPLVVFPRKNVRVDVEKLKQARKEKIYQMAAEESDKVEMSGAKKIKFTVAFKDKLKSIKEEKQQEVSHSTIYLGS
ncbi:Uncharacterised protein [Legionella sainthelensi]|uniref:DUF4116 domain-containing protein n=1 Tax=Legionella sainthelensi TaxID=28087 RepID=UPI000F6FA926|nr:DUF4116 domain-containing protein [Legionella sainthelensi]VEB34520.1 Uncharacterised protein [Legionella sainthelensi]